MVDAEPPPPAPVPEDSDVAVVAARKLVDAFLKTAPDAAEVVSSDSIAGISELLDGTADIAYATRKLSQAERAVARDNRVAAVEHVIAYDALVVYLHHDNPAKSLSFRQLLSIFGEGGRAEKWIDLELKVPGCYSGRIERFRLPGDFTATLDFQAAVLGEERGWKAGGREVHSSEELVFQVERTPCAVGYSSLFWVIERAKRACIDPEAREYTPTDYPNDCVYPKVETLVEGTYPLTRPLVLITRGKPSGEIKEYVEWILSDVGQCLLEDQGFAPVESVDCSVIPEELPQPGAEAPGR